MTRERQTMRRYALFFAFVFLFSKVPKVKTLSATGMVSEVIVLRVQAATTRPSSLASIFSVFPDINHSHHPLRQFQLSLSTQSPIIAPLLG